MADSIQRIVPPSVSLDRAPALGRERQKKSGEEKPRPRLPEDDRQPPETRPKGLDNELSNAEPEKGKNVDISA